MPSYSTRRAEPDPRRHHGRRRRAGGAAGSADTGWTQDRGHRAAADETDERRMADAAVRLPGHADRRCCSRKGRRLAFRYGPPLGTRHGSRSAAFPRSCRRPGARLSYVATMTRHGRQPIGSCEDAREMARRWARCRLATPWPERRQDASDFNDTIRAGGADAVRAQSLRRSIQLFRSSTGCPSLRLAECSTQKLGRSSRQPTHTIPRSGAAPVHAIRVDVGAGKTTIARQRAAEMRPPCASVMTCARSSSQSRRTGSATIRLRHSRRCRRRRRQN